MFLVIKDLKKSFGTAENRTEVLKGIDFSVEKGQICVLLGPSGSGKSTLLNIIGGIDQADEGYVSINGEKTADMKEKRLTQYRRRHLGYVFQMYNVHQDATYLPIEVQCENKQVRARMGQDGEQRTLPMLGATASKAQDGAVHISLSNVDLENSNEVTVDLSGLGMKSVAGRILTCKAITDKNTFEQPDVVKPADFKGAKLKNGKLAVKMPPMSIVALELR